MRILKSHPILKLANLYIIDASQPSNISYLWNFGSLLLTCLVVQIITGVTLAMHYTPNVLEAFNSVEHIMRDVNNGWLIRYLHSNTASAFFFLVYLHMGRGLYYGSYRAPRTLTWTIGTIIFLLLVATGFLGYVLPYGQMSLWGATVITNLISAIPWIGQDIVEFIWGGFSVNNATLNRFFALHFVLPFILVALVLMHMIALHDSAGSSNPVGVSGNYDRVPFAPYYLFKDLITIFIFIIGLSLFVFFMPNALGDSENYIMANPMQTPPAIVPEWYLLPFYAILRSIPNKLLGVIAMFSAILIILILSLTDIGKIKGSAFRPLMKIILWIFVVNFMILGILGAKHVESPFIEFGQISTVLYFSYFLIAIAIISLFENTLFEIRKQTSDNKFSKTIRIKSEVTFFPLLLFSNISFNYINNIFNNINSITYDLNTKIMFKLSIIDMTIIIILLTSIIISIWIIFLGDYEDGNPYGVYPPANWDGKPFVRHINNAHLPGNDGPKAEITWIDRTDDGLFVLKTERTWRVNPRWTQINTQYKVPISLNPKSFYCHNYNPSGQRHPMPHYFLNIAAPLPFTNKYAKLTNPNDPPNPHFMWIYHAGPSVVNMVN
jgi:ubiquinol-cytochrome c reductase cytochrome b subunit